MNMKTKCTDCGGEIVAHTLAPNPLWFCATCTRIYDYRDMLQIPKQVEGQKIEHHQHHMVCSICGLAAECEEDED